MLAIYRWINYCTRLCRDVRIIIIDGPPGSGKSTVASKMADVLSYEHIEVDEFIDRTIRAINYELLAHINCGIQGGFIISGYPLTEDNIKFISNNLDVSAIFLLNCTTHTSYLRQKIDTYSAKYRLDMYNKHLHNHELLRNMLHVPILYVDANRQLTNVISDITDTMNKIYSDNEDIIYPISGGCKKTKENHLPLSLMEP